MELWLRGSRQIRPVDKEEWDDKSVSEYMHDRVMRSVKERWILKIPSDLFDDFGNLKPMLPGDWDDKRVTYAKFIDVPPPSAATEGSSLNEEIPF